jgi:hypothetical protein
MMIIGISTFQYAAIYWLGDANLWQVELMASLKLNKPWIYRQLVPMLARSIASLGIRIDLALVLVVTAAGVGFYLALRSLAFLFYKQDDKAEILIILLALLGMIIFGYERLPYDLMTASLFTLAFLYIARGDSIRLLIIFTLACLNRETSFLMITFLGMMAFARVEARNRWGLMFFMTLIYIVVQLTLRIVFRENDGLSNWIEPALNLLRFKNHPVRTLAHASSTLVLLWLACKDWKQKPYFLRLALIAIGPPLVLLYLIFGQAFEVRVFWETFPILALLMLPTLHDLRNVFLITTVL